MQSSKCYWTKFNLNFEGKFPNVNHVCGHDGTMGIGLLQKDLTVPISGSSFEFEMK